MKTHHREMAFRPPRREHSNEAGDLSLFLRFLRVYVLPHRWMLTIIAVWWCATAAVPFLMAWYTRVVVDDILVIAPAAAQPAPGASETPNGTDRHPAARTRPAIGRERRAEQDPLSGRSPGAGRQLALMFAVYLGTMVATNLGSRVEVRARVRIGQNLTARLREDLHAKVMRLSVGYHKAHAPGRLMARVLSDVGVVQDQMYLTILTVLSCLTMVLVGFTILVFVQWQFAVIVACTLPFYVYFYKRTIPPLRATNVELRHTNSCLYSLASQKLDGIRAIQAYSRERHERLILHRLSACFLRDAMAQQRLNATLSMRAGLTASLGTGALFLYGTVAVLDGRMTLGALMFAYGAASNLFSPVLTLSQINTTVSQILVVLHRLRQVLDEPEEIKEDPNAVDCPSPLKTGISVRGVSFRYGAQGDPVLEDISFEVPAGTWLCVMGPSGAGKSTLLYVLDRLYQAGRGDIVIDDAPLNHIRFDSLRRRMALVPQEAQIFSGTLRDNICYGFPDASANEIMDAARAAEIHDFIMTLPVKYETIIGEKGATLSGGQRQRISLARALLTKPEILLLDDCTSALDAETERRIQETLQRILVGKTAVIVSQRVSMAMRCHRICVLGNGRVTEFGTHQQLLDKPGFYARLHAQQTK